MGTDKVNNSWRLTGGLLLQAQKNRENEGLGPPICQEYFTAEFRVSGGCHPDEFRPGSAAAGTRVSIVRYRSYGIHT